MRVLLDTCEFLWLVTGDPRLPSSVAAAVRDPANEVYLSAVSFWEISVKHALGKLPLPQPPEHVPVLVVLRFPQSSSSDKTTRCQVPPRHPERGCSRRFQRTIACRLAASQ